MPASRREQNVHITNPQRATESVERSHRVLHVQRRQLIVVGDMQFVYRPEWNLDASGDHRHRFWVGPECDQQHQATELETDLVGSGWWRRRIGKRFSQVRPLIPLNLSEVSRV